MVTPWDLMWEITRSKYILVVPLISLLNVKFLLLEDSISSQEIQKLIFFILLLALTPNIVFLLSLSRKTNNVHHDPHFINVVHIFRDLMLLLRVAYLAMFLLLILTIRTRKS